VIDGLEALVRQGAKSFELWTGVDAPASVMRDAVRAAV
jgi:shikimate dehydrogenase